LLDPSCPQHPVGNSNLSPGAYRCAQRPPNWLHGRSPRRALAGPLDTPLDAPRGRQGRIAEGGRTGRVHASTSRSLPPLSFTPECDSPLLCLVASTLDRLLGWSGQGPSGK
jgi:hypothetical protein